MREVRCLKCNKLLGKIKGEAEIKCPRCGTINNINSDRERQKSAS